jgi:hypothetical protein
MEYTNFKRVMDSNTSIEKTSFSTMKNTVSALPRMKPKCTGYARTWLHRIKMTSIAILSIIAIQSLSAQPAPHVISFFIRPLPAYPTPAQEKFVEEHKKKSVPDSLLKSIINKELNTNFLHSGIYVTYAGMSALSNSEGQVTFERKTPEKKLNVIVAEDLKAVPVDPLNNKTIYGFMVNPKAAAHQYSFELLQDPETEIYSWYVNHVPLVKGKRIPYDTIVIFANPKHVIVPIGATATSVSENFLLPDLYATPQHKSGANALRFLKIRQYSAPVKFDTKFYPEEYQQIIRP